LKIYTAKAGDTLLEIAKKHHVDIEALTSLNQHIESPYLNIHGEKIRIPSVSISVGNFTNASQLEPPPTLRNNWIPLTPLEQMEQTEYDVLIIGTGAGGGAVTWRLCEQWGRNGKRIGIVEAGNFLMPTHPGNIPTMNSERMQKYHEYVSKPLGDSLPEFPGAKQVFAFGGRTLFWNAISPRMSHFELAKWPVPFQEMESYYNIAERVMNVSQQYTEGSSITEILLNRLQQGGFPEATVPPIAAKLSVEAYGQKGSDVFFSSISFLAKALHHRSLDVTVRTRAVQVLVDKGRVAGVRVISPDKKSYVLQAKTVVLSASTFETPRLLLYSGIQGKAIGHYLMNHPYVTATGSISRKEFPENLGTLGVLVPSTRERPYQIQLRGPNEYFWYQPYQERPLLHELKINFLCSGEITPRFENKVTLDPYRKDEFGVPEVQVHFSLSERETAIIREIYAVIQQIASSCGISMTSPAHQPSICLMPIGDQNHDSGTCRMGDDPATSVVNRYGQVHGISGLYVADNSVLPSLGAANPTLTTIALAIRTADYIIRKEEPI